METKDANLPNYIKDLEKRAYQEELFQKSVLRNTIVYLGTGSGKTYVAVKLINHHRGKLKDGNKIIFLVNNVALVEQQAMVIRDHSGLSVGSYCGADGVDDWDDEMWKRELDQHQVLVLVHQIFEDMLTHSYFQLSQAVLLIMDECHHAVKKHPYSNIMEEWYWREKNQRKPVPKILGLTACVVVKTVTEDKFKEEKAKLENKMDATVTTTEDLAEILKFVTNPDEEILWYPMSNEAVPIADTINEVINAAIFELDQEKETEIDLIKKKIQDINTRTGQTNDLKKDFSILKNEIFGNMENGLNQLGLATLHNQIPGVEQFLQKQYTKTIFYSPNCQQKLVNIAKEKVQLLKEMTNATIDKDQGTELEKLMKFTTRKVHALLDILRTKNGRYPDIDDSLSNFSSTDTDDKSLSIEDMNMESKKLKGPMAAIVFVERRNTAEVLCEVINKMAKLDPSFNHIRADYATRGEKCNPRDPKQRDTAILERKKLLETLARFKRGETNVLVATSVIEEGIDVRRCNLVIKFDPPQTFRSYVQSKGRARAHPSSYIIMAGDLEFGKIQDQYQNYKKVEEISIKLCHHEKSVGDDDREEREEPYLAEPEDPDNSARLNGSQAISLVHQYLQKIPVDRFTRLTPAWQIQEVKGDSQASMLAGLGIASCAGFRVTCTMPHKTPIHEPVEGEVRPTKDWAKRCCALMVCRRLHQEGELDNRLKVRRRKNLVEENEEEDDEDPRGFKAGTKRRRRIYEKNIPKKLSVENGRPMFLHLVKMDLVEPIQNPRYRLGEATHDHLGLLLPSVFPSVGPIRLFTASGKMDVHIRFLNEYKGKEEVLSLIEDFHTYVFSHILKIVEYMDITGSYLVLPLIENIEYCINIEMLRSSRFSSPIPKIPDTNKDIYEQVVFPTYKGNVHSHYFVEDVVKYLKASDAMPQRQNEKSSPTFMEYYFEKYRYHIKDPSQSVLRVSSADKRPYMIKEGHEQHSEGGRRSDPKHLHERMLLVPELLGVEPVPVGLWRQCQILPFVLHRLNSLLSVEELQKSLVGPGHDSSLELRLGVDDLKRLDHLSDRANKFAQLLLSNSGACAPNVPQLLQALTLKCTDDHYDMEPLERLEILGDVFLKYIISVVLYYKFLGDEGQLTLYRSRIVGNKNLFRCAARLGMDRAVVSEKMEIHGGWQVPGFTRKALEDKLVEMDRRFVDYVEEGKKGRVGTGSMMEWLLKEDIGLVLNGNEEELLKKAASRFNEGKTEGRVVLKEYKVLADKSLADCVEAVIGCNLLVGGQKQAQEVMQKMAVVKDDHEWNDFEQREDAFINEWRRVETELAQQLYDKMELEKIERIIGYKFKEKSFLLQAFTHASAGENRLTESYERLEYLGDAVLDYLVTCFVFCHTNYGPGQVTDARSALVNNNMFASVLVDNKLHPYILHSSPNVQAKIEDYLDDRREDSSGKTSSGERLISSLELFNEVEVPELSLVEVPKVLGDVLEALMGAVYEDSGHDLPKVWQVYQRLCPNFGEVVQRPPQNTKKQLMEKFPDKVKFSKPEVKENRVSMVATVEVRPETFKRFRGIGNNKKNAMMAASKCALRKLVAVDLQI